MATDNQRLVTLAAFKNGVKDFVSGSALTSALSSYVTNSSLASTLSGYVQSSSLANTLASYVMNSDNTGVRANAVVPYTGSGVTVKTGTNIVRVGNMVHAYVDFTIPATGYTTGNYVFTFPAGYRPAAQEYIDVALGGGTANQRYVVYGDGNVRLYYGTANTQYRASFIYATKDAMPTTLPGTAL